jgi:hypothetical protein
MSEGQTFRSEDNAFILKTAIEPGEESKRMIR